MKADSWYHIEQNGERFFIGDPIRVNVPGIDLCYGKITHITQNGFYLDAGEKKDKYFNFRNEMEITGCF